MIKVRVYFFSGGPDEESRTYELGDDSTVADLKTAIVGAQDAAFYNHLTTGFEITDDPPRPVNPVLPEDTELEDDDQYHAVMQ